MPLLGGYFLETDPVQIGMVIRGELFIHKPYEANANWHCTATHGQLCYSMSSVWQGLWMNSSTLIPWQLGLAPFEKLPPGFQF